MVTAPQAQRFRQRLDVAAQGGQGMPTIKPHWDQAAGKLWYGEALVRIVKARRDSTMVQLLNAFEAAEWPARIDSPFQEDHKLKDAVRTFNDGRENTVVSLGTRDNGHAAIWCLNANSH
jgi:hypothetical protein